LEEAISINDVQIEMNTQAFRVGRLLVADPALAPDGRAAPRGLGHGAR
jgi:hypothetical protein